jgi:Skp family chaperone for outer membrane proteins
VKTSTKKVAQEQGFEIVLQGEALYVSNDKYDITDKVKKAVESSKL